MLNENIRGLSQRFDKVLSEINTFFYKLNLFH